MSKPPNAVRVATPLKSGEAVECCSKDQTQLHNNAIMSVMKRHPSTTWTSFSNMPKDIAKYAIDRPSFGDVKARDMELQSNSEPIMDPFQKAVVYLKSDQLMEKVYVASKTEEFIRKDIDRYFRDIFPLMEKELRLEVEELHSEAASGFGGAYRFLLSKSPTNANTVLQLIFRLLESRNSNICESWSTVVVDLINMLGHKDLENDFLPHILVKSKSNIANVRKMMSFIIKHLIVRSPPLGKALAGVISALLNDPMAVVRGSMCQQLGPIYHSMPSKDGLTEHIDRISKDNDPIVKKSLIITIGGIYKYPDMKGLHDLIFTLLKRTIKEAFVQGQVDILLEFTSYIGEMAKVMTEAGSLNGDSKLWFFDAYIQLSRIGLVAPPGATDQNLPTGFINFRNNMGYNRRHSLVESLVSSGALPTTGTNTSNKKAIIENGWKIRTNAAKDFVNFFKFARPLVDFRVGLQPLIGDLIHDPHECVRAAISSCFWPVMETLGNNGHHLHGEFVYLLSDDSLEVVEGITPHISKILKVLVNGKIISTEQATQYLVEIGGALIFCEERLSQSNSWRVHTQFLSQLTVLPFCLPSDYIYNNFVPNLFHRLLHLRHLPARMGVADAIVSFLRHCRRVKQREEIRHRINESFAKGKSVQDRMLYLYMSRRIIDTFSRKYFREYFFDQTLRMADDAVANVRMKAVTMMPDMKNTLQRSDDERLLQKLDEAAMRLREMETDSDVLNAIDEAIQGMQRIGLRFAGDKAPKTKADAEDEAKEKEEQYIENLEPPAASANQAQAKDKGYYKSQKPVIEPSSVKNQPINDVQGVQKAKPIDVGNSTLPVSTVAIDRQPGFRRRTLATGEVVPLIRVTAQSQRRN